MAVGCPVHLRSGPCYVAASYLLMLCDDQARLSNILKVGAP